MLSVLQQAPCKGLGKVVTSHYMKKNEYTFEPIKPTDGFKMTTSGKVDKRNDVRLSFLTKEFSNVPSSKIDDRRAGMPPAMYTPPLANAFKPKFAASVP